MISTDIRRALQNRSAWASSTRRNRLDFDQQRRIDQCFDDDRRRAGTCVTEVLGTCCAGGGHILRANSTPIPASARIAMMFRQQASACASIVSGTVPSGSTPTSPEM
jgi:hypothetical protein